MNEDRVYIAIDLKSFYASVECVERGLDPLTANLVVADASRTDKTICLAVSPSLKKYGISGRARLFEVVQRVGEINYERRHQGRGDMLEYITAVPRMAHYIEFSKRIYEVYLKYIAAEDIHVYSIDEVFIDATTYLRNSRMSARELAMTMIRDVLKTTGITATAGIGTNMYLCKIAMDIVAKHSPADKDGVRIAEIDEMSYRRELWNHRPLTDFWRVGRGTARKLEMYGIYTMGDIARQSINDEDLLYRLFGVNAELLIDHAWGWEPCTIDMVRAYRPDTRSMSSGQVLTEAYTLDKARVVMREMADAVALDLTDKHKVTDQIVLTIGYDVENLTNPVIRGQYKGETTTDRYGRQVPRHAHGTFNLPFHTSSSKAITDAVMQTCRRIADPLLLIRRITISVNNVVDEDSPERKVRTPVQLDLFTDYAAIAQQKKKENEQLAKEHKLQEATLRIKKMYGKNAILKALSFDDGATARQRNEQIGGHRA